MQDGAVTYIRHSEIFGNRPKINDILSELAAFNYFDIEELLAKLNCILWQDIPPSHAVQEALIKALFSQTYIQEANRDLARRLSQEIPTVFFHPQQCLWLMKYAAQVCPRRGGDAITGESIQRLGPIFMKANDFLTFERRREQQEDDEEMQHDEILAELLPSYELLNPPIPKYEIARAEIWFSDTIKRIQAGDQLDINGIFEAATGMSIDKFIELTMIMLLPYINRIPTTELMKDITPLFIKKKTFLKQTEIPEKLAKVYFENISILAQELPDQVYFSIPLPPQYDFLVFRKFPFVEFRNKRLICVYPPYLIDKLFEGIYFILFNELQKSSQESKLPEIWGHIFEAYTTDLLADAFKSGPDCFVANPIFDGTKEEVADGLLRIEKEIVLFESKASRLALQAVCSGDVSRIERELKTKFVASNSGSKGVGQLATNIREIFSDNSSDKKSYSNLDPSSVERIFPVLITLDENLSAPLLNHKLNLMFQNLISRWTFLKHPVEIMPLVLITIRDLETLVQNLKNERFSMLECLKDICKKDPERMLPFRECMRRSFYRGGSDRNEVLETRSQEILDRIQKYALGEEDRA